MNTVERSPQRVGPSGCYDKVDMIRHKGIGMDRQAKDQRLLFQKPEIDP
jgi:hypothetical protein